jgi:starch synthase (maltosyl-transferring)
MQNQKRVIIDFVSPQVNCGEFFIKRVLNEVVTVNAHVLADGHDIIAASVLFKHENEKKWREVRMQPVENDEWTAVFVVDKQGFYNYKVEGWIDYALNWQYGLSKKIENNQNVTLELLEGIYFLQEASKKASTEEKKYLKKLQNVFTDSAYYDESIKLAINEKLHCILLKYPGKKWANSSKNYQVYVDRLKARFSTWYEFFPRSSSENSKKHGTFNECMRLLPRIEKMGFDTLYFPPIHPIGLINRKGKNNTTKANKSDVGSTWGIGSEFGGHCDVHPQLGTIDDFKLLVKKAKDLDIEIALDFALQAAPDHPWVKEHPEWFKWRPDGTVQYAENPPKKYQDILPIFFETEDYKNLWKACLDVLNYWIVCGIRIFRVDNPHTKPFYFWNWIITEVKKKHPDILFLAEAFTRPKIMHQLAKQGFSQSYTYFTWRDTKYELEEYMKELTRTDQSQYMRPNFWLNTPDINPFHLQDANESKYMQRYVLAATLSSNIGIYGPVFELMLSDALPDKEEYSNSEKFQICHYDWSIKNNLIKIITQVNGIRIEQEALQQTNNILFCSTDNDKLIAYYKWNDARTNELLIIVNLDHQNTQQGYVQLPLNVLNDDKKNQIQVVDLIDSNRYYWNNEWNFVELQCNLPFHIFKIVRLDDQ